MTKTNKQYLTEYYHFKDDGVFPNSRLAVIIYKGILNLPFSEPEECVKELFEDNDWSNSWEGGIYEYHHYHSITHEVLGIYKGKATLLLGGDKGMKVAIEKGDVLIIPAGVAHKNLDAENAIGCIGAYPGGKEYDINYGKPEERPEVDNNIRQVPLPSKDPVFGISGGIDKIWQ